MGMHCRGIIYPGTIFNSAAVSDSEDDGIIFDFDSNYDDEVATLTSTFLHIFQSTIDFGLIQNLKIDVSISIIEHSGPDSACVEALATSILYAAKARPGSVDIIVLATREILASVGSLTVHDYPGGPLSFEYLLRYFLADCLKDALYGPRMPGPEHTEITPTNPTLVAALFSASAIHKRLLRNVASPYRFLRQGLQLSGPVNQKREVVLALGACLQLSVAGKWMMQDWLEQSDGREDGQEAMLKALNKLKDNHVIRAPAGIELLNKTIEIVQGKCTLALSPAAAWDLLFVLD
ncbi:hypothetical protein BDQ12DRAFT_737454 [Crucibulum laeve]|uniref:Uncharacterized protein n=1 Tax=Crucibulum laeve TaxID=68775 RepID=A0A5C3LSG2_9AGAR|nr:hypothetical protein BDQ12DRAFT_737454 [Crucibulum laeve]